MREKISLNNNWNFYPEEHPEQVTKVRIPHTFVETPLRYFDESIYQFAGIYEYNLEVPADWAGKQIYLVVGAAAQELTVSINGFEKGVHRCGYTSYRTEITEELVDGNNCIRLRVDASEKLNQPPFGNVIDYMTYGGIYREVYLEVLERIHTESIVIRTERKDESSYDVFVEHETRPTKIQLMLETEYLIRKDGEEVFSWTEVHDSTEAMHHVAFTVENITEWSLECPALYDMEVIISRDKKVDDSVSESFGFREVKFKPDGFYLNEKKVKLRGLNRHQSYPYVGYAMPDSMQEWDALLLKKELGVNAVRTSHYPQSPAFLRKCDELGLLVFTEIPGWQYIGDEAWQEIALQNVREMILQNINHPSIILWGVRINESADCDAFYKKTNALAHELDPSRPTGGVRANKQGSFLEDVYTYNDFSHRGDNDGCERKVKVTPDVFRPYLVSEYNGHMYPTKPFDDEEQRREQMLRHARVVNDIAGQSDIAGGFGWCMFDYNTHKDFGSGDRICYHGVMDAFRNSKMAALVYACEGIPVTERPILELSSSMDIGEHPACERGKTYILTNADSVRMYKNDLLIKEYHASDSKFRNLAHGPILIDDYVGDQIFYQEKFTKRQARIITDALNYSAVYGYNDYPLGMLLGLLQCKLWHQMTMEDAVRLYNKYIGDWGQTATAYRFEAIHDGEIVSTLVKSPVTSVRLLAELSSDKLIEKESYDAAALRIRAVDQNGNTLPYFTDPVEIRLQGPVELIGPSTITLDGGMGGSFLKTIGEIGSASVTIACPGRPEIEEVKLFLTADRKES